MFFFHRPVSANAARGPVRK